MVISKKVKSLVFFIFVLLLWGLSGQLFSDSRVLSENSASELMQHVTNTPIHPPGPTDTPTPTPVDADYLPVIFRQFGTPTSGPSPTPTLHVTTTPKPPPGPSSTPTVHITNTPEPPPT